MYVTLAGDGVSGPIQVSVLLLIQLRPGHNFLSHCSWTARFSRLILILRLSEGASFSARLLAWIELS